ncbi:Gag-Pol polyprotein [Folsomia candida]|uniref:Gag-Pol polyprotein n=1 Tax=Folsomia candida TaxID=158441 RepID=A0A226DMG9_FOLCA|nr:Gag-Pol polyprotein [Folsomia candida]
MAPSAIDKAVHDRSSISDTLDFLEVEVTNHATTPLDEAGINHLLAMAKTSQLEVMDIHKKIQATAPADMTPHVTEYQRLLRKACRIVTTMTGFKLKIPGTPTVSTSTTNSEIRLPILELPTFDGNLHEWVSFRDMFVTAVHDNTKLSKSQKFTYLKSQLKGEAARQLQSMIITDANYDIAWSQLSDRYQNDRELLFAIMRKFTNQPIVQSQSATAIRQLVDVSRECIRSLQVLKLPTDQWDAILLFLMMMKMDSSSKELWEQSLNDSAIPTLKSFFDFLEQRARALAASGTSTTPKNASKSNNNYHGDKSRTPRSLVHVTATKSSNSCKCCDEPSHPIYRCEKFIQFPVQQRCEVTRKHNFCYNCLTEGHQVSKCTSNKGCRTCGGRHHTMLHRPTPSDHSTGTRPRDDPNGGAIVHLTSTSTSQGYNNKSNVETPPQSSRSFSLGKEYDTLLATALVQVLQARKHGHYHTVRILADNACNTNFATESCARRIGLPRRRYLTSATGLGGAAVATSSGFTWFTITPHFDTSVTFTVSRCLLTNKITGKLPTSKFDHTRWPHLQGINLSDPSYHEPEEVDMLLGAEFFFAILEGGKRSGPPNSPVALETSFGWLIGGGSSDSPLIQPTVHTTLTPKETTTPNSTHFSSTSDQEDEHLDSLLRKFWEMENEPPTRLLSPEESAAETHFTSTYTRDDEGRFMVRIPFKTPRPKLGHSLKIAEKRLMYLERRLQANPTYRQEYHSFMKEYEQLGHMTEVTNLDSGSGNKCYLPHHFVLKPSSTTTKFRVVFDASAKTSNNISLNDTMLVGPTIQDPLIDLLIRFRLHRIAFTADIAKMYRQILVHPEDAEMQRILWREDSSGPIRHYKLNTVTYGTASASFLATRAVKEVSTVEKKNYPQAAEAAARDLYMDDLMSGEPTIKQALNTQTQIIALAKSACLSLRKWSSNSQAVLDSLPPEMRETQSLDLFDLDSSVKTLGISWNPKSDHFFFRFNPQPNGNKPLNKRTVLSEIARLFDPIGWLAPIMINAKILMQSLWKLHQGWDDELPQDVQQQWMEFKVDLQQLCKLKIKRCFFKDSSITCPSLNIPYPLTTLKICLAGFCDASEKAFAAVVYLCAYQGSCSSISLITSKTRVAPTKVVSLPRLELCGAVLLAELIPKVKTALKIPIHSVSAWTDSTVTLAWIKSNPSRWKTFVANRVTRIQDKVPLESWSHVRGDDNPADCPSRGIKCDELIHHPLWWNGPSWLKCGIPNPTTVQVLESEDVSKEERQVTCHITLSDTDQALLCGTSSLRKLQRVTAFVLRFVRNCRNPNLHPQKTKSHHPLTPGELHQALNHWVKVVQHQAFYEDLQQLKKGQPLHSKSKILSLSPFLDETGVIRVGGRLKSSSLSPDQKNPILLPYHGQLTHLIIQDAHIRHFHAGPQLMMAVIQRQFWIIRARDAIRYFTRKCVNCIRQRASTMQQVMADLPAFRVNQSRPFLKCGVDYAGPFMLKPLLKGSKITIKAYLAVFVCCVTRALHLEVVSDLTTEAFLAALKRFIARRGRPTDVYSDCGTNFVGAMNEMKDVMRLLLSKSHNDKIANYMSTDGITWHLNSPASPHFGGLWEAGVKSIKYHLRRVIGLQRLNFEEMTTAICQIEAILNSRPLTAESTDPQDLAALTPGHFLIGAPLTAIPEPSLDHIKQNQLSHWQLLQQLMQSFWKRWSAEYLTRLQQRPKWMAGNKKISVGELVLIKDENLPPLKWKLGRVLALHPGPDSIVRVVTLKTSNGEIKRPIVKICPLSVPSSDPNQDDDLVLTL